ncbi:MAG TPA: hypothetical protein VJ837_00750 [Candidatus Paceibacterota bacterium]|nr:hypothetical protein [Candidatus Paceibacterota bacterium]
MGPEGSENKEKAIPPAYHYKDGALSGREASGATDDISTPQESGESMEERVSKGVREIMQAFGLRPQEVMGMTGFFMTQLSQRGYLSETDLRFNPESVVEDLLQGIAKKAA